MVQEEKEQWKKNEKGQRRTADERGFEMRGTDQGAKTGRKEEGQGESSHEARIWMTRYEGIVDKGWERDLMGRWIEARAKVPTRTENGGEFRQVVAGAERGAVWGLRVGDCEFRFSCKCPDEEASCARSPLNSKKKQRCSRQTKRFKLPSLPKIHFSYYDSFPPFLRPRSPQLLAPTANFIASINIIDN